MFRVLEFDRNENKLTFASDVDGLFLIKVKHFISGIEIYRSMMDLRINAVYFIVPIFKDTVILSEMDDCRITLEFNDANGTCQFKEIIITGDKINNEYNQFSDSLNENALWSTFTSIFNDRCLDNTVKFNEITSVIDFSANEILTRYVCSKNEKIDKSYIHYHDKIVEIRDNIATVNTFSFDSFTEINSNKIFFKTSSNFYEESINLLKKHAFKVSQMLVEFKPLEIQQAVSFVADVAKWFDISKMVYIKPNNRNNIYYIYFCK